MFSSLRKSWLTKLSRTMKGRPVVAQSAMRRKNHLKVELLEDRVTPSTYTVVNTNYSGLGSLGDAITQAVTASDTAAIINFSVANNSVIQLNNLSVDANPANFGNSAFVVAGLGTNITIDGSGVAGLTIDGGSAVRIFQV